MKRSRAEPGLAAMLASLAGGDQVVDREFDRLYPKAVQKLSRTHWSSVAVARRAAELLMVESAARILDVGSGAGKFCIVGALSTTGHYTGIEQHAELVQVAKAVAKDYRLERVRFLAGDALAQDWTKFDGVYLYNPFAARIRLEGAKDLDQPETQQDAVMRVLAKLAELRPGSRVAIHHGYGGPQPPGFRTVAVETHGSGTLEVWTRL